MKKIFRKVHLWLAVPFGLIMTLTCFSGAMLVFETEITEALRADFYRVGQPSRNDARPLSMNVLASRVAATLPDSVSLTGVSLSPIDASRPYFFSLSAPRRAQVAVNQYTGEVKGRVERLPFFATMFGLHRWLLDSMKPNGGLSVGKLVVGISTLAFVFVLVSGIAVWWPRTRRALVQSLKLTWRHGRFSFWHSLHVAGGMYAVVFLLVMALTGLTWSFDWYRAGFYALFAAKPEVHGGAPKGKALSSEERGSGEKQHKAGKEPYDRHTDRHSFNATLKKAGGVTGASANGEKTAHSAAEKTYETWQMIADYLSAANPSARTISISGNSATVAVSGYGNIRATDRYDFDPNVGQVTAIKPYAEASRAQKIRGWIYAVHTGSFGGIFTRILAFVTALIGASLPLTGYYLWIRRLCRKHRAT